MRRRSARIQHVHERTILSERAGYGLPIVQCRAYVPEMRRSVGFAWEVSFHDQCELGCGETFFSFGVAFNLVCIMHQYNDRHGQSQSAKCVECLIMDKTCRLSENVESRYGTGKK